MNGRSGVSIGGVRTVKILRVGKKRSKAGKEKRPERPALFEVLLWFFLNERIYPFTMDLFLGIFWDSLYQMGHIVGVNSL